MAPPPPPLTFMTSILQPKVPPNPLPAIDKNTSMHSTKTPTSLWPMPLKQVIFTLYPTPLPFPRGSISKPWHFNKSNNNHKNTIPPRPPHIFPHHLIIINKINTTCPEKFAQFYDLYPITIRLTSYNQTLSTTKKYPQTLARTLLTPKSIHNPMQDSCIRGLNSTHIFGTMMVTPFKMNYIRTAKTVTMPNVKTWQNFKTIVSL